MMEIEGLLSEGCVFPSLQAVMNLKRASAACPKQKEVVLPRRLRLGKMSQYLCLKSDVSPVMLGMFFLVRKLRRHGGS